MLFSGGYTGPIVWAGDYSNGDPVPEQCMVPFRAGTFTNVSQAAPNEVDLEVTFLDHPLLVDDKWVDTSPSGNAADFGIRAIALTG